MTVLKMALPVSYIWYEIEILVVLFQTDRLSLNEMRTAFHEVGVISSICLKVIFIMKTIRPSAF